MTQPGFIRDRGQAFPSRTWVKSVGDRLGTWDYSATTLSSWDKENSFEIIGGSDSDYLYTVAETTVAGTAEPAIVSIEITPGGTPSLSGTLRESTLPVSLDSSGTGTLYDGGEVIYIHESDRFHVVNVATPSNPSYYDTTGTGVTTRGPVTISAFNRRYRAAYSVENPVGGGNDLFYTVFDSPSAPASIRSFGSRSIKASNVSAVSTEGETVYLNTNVAVDISDPSNPVRLGRVREVGVETSKRIEFGEEVIVARQPTQGGVAEIFSRSN